MKIDSLLDEIRNHDLVLPEFQREYVWSKDQAKQLLSSLLKGYPVGALLIWKTDQPPDLKNVDELPEKLGMVRVLLDGQQRLTTLYMLIEGEIPPYYTESDITTDPRDLYYNLDSRDLQYYQISKMRGNPLWRRVVNCFSDSTINVFEIAKQRSGTDQEAFELAQRYNDHLTRLRNIKALDLSEQTVPSHASLDEAIDIFDLVNRQGTKLTDAELALTHVTGKWPTCRREMKAKIEELNEQHFYFDLRFMTRALTGAVTRRALFDEIHKSPRQELEAGWTQLSKILDYLVNILPGHASINSTKDLSTTNALVPFIVYLSLNGGKFPNEKSLKHAVNWLYAALIWARYTAQTDQRLEHDLSLILREEAPWARLRAQIIDQRGRIEVKPSDFEGRGVQHPLYRAVYVLAKAHSAVDWDNGSTLSKPHGAYYQIHNHHIFPQSLLYKSGYESDNHLHRKIVNEIANMAFLTASSNLWFSNKPPEEYLPKVEESYPGALAKQFIPMDPKLWKVERYSDFLEARRELIARKLNEFMAALIAEPQETQEQSISDLIALDESATLEFKSTLQWDVVHNQPNKHLRHSVIKTIAAFLNSEGGTLLIGVDDGKVISGLNQDLKLLGGSLDRFEQLLNSLIADYIGPEYARFVTLHTDGVDGKQVCVVDVDKAPGPAFVNGTRGREFYVRLGNTTRALDPEETVRYIDTSWG